MLKGNKKLNLKISKIRILNDEEALEKKKEIFGIKRMDFSLLIHEDIEENIVLICLSDKFRKENEIVDAKIKEIFKKQEFKDKKSVCYEIYFVNRNLKEKE
ncbi:MAG: hypothetical protein ACK4YO_02650 [Candidatus Altarchaeaceae archaeon]